MEKIRDLPTKIINGNRVSFAIYLCPFCSKEVIKRLSDGKRCKSCGCVQYKDINHNNIKHGESNTKLYRAYYDILSRCFNSKRDNYKNYGGRGITICPEWTDKLNGYINFRNWSLTNGYSDNLEIDRKNTNGNYEPSNCRWVTHKENLRNKRNNKLTLEIANEIRELHKTGNYTQKELAKRYDIDFRRISAIINNKTWNKI